MDIDTFLSVIINKNDDNINSHKSNTLSYLENFENYQRIYTDGSKTQNEQTGFGVYIPDSNHRIIQALHPTHSVYLAEMHAILTALQYIQNYTNNNKKFIILTDSLSSLQTLQNLNPKTLTKLLLDILETQDTLTKAGYHIKFIWIPSHVGIPGNEIADKLAKQATLLDSINLQPTYTLQEIYKEIDNKSLENWQKHYNETNEAIHYKQIEPGVSYTLKSTFKNINKERIISAIKFNNLKLNHYLHKIKPHPTGFCHYCNSISETTKHFILECTHFNITSNITTKQLKEIITNPLHSEGIYSNIIKLRPSL